MSVDDAIKDTIEAVDQLGQSNNTYFLYSSEPPDSETLCKPRGKFHWHEYAYYRLCKSQTEKPRCGCAGDHGFQLGELNLPQDKRNVYEFDIKIHLLARGQGIRPDVVWMQRAQMYELDTGERRF